MKLKFSWLNARKNLFLCSLVDFVLFIYLFFRIFKDSISYQLLFIFLTLFSALIWIISSYIIGRYTNFNFEKDQIIYRQFIKTFLNIFFNLFFTQVIFRIFWEIIIKKQVLPFFLSLSLSLYIYIYTYLFNIAY